MPGTGRTYLAVQTTRYASQISVFDGIQLTAAFTLPEVNDLTWNPYEGHLYAATVGSMGGSGQFTTIINDTQVITSVLLNQPWTSGDLLGSHTLNAARG